MKLRTDLLKYLTTEDVLEEALANNHRYSAEPVFAKTGVGYLKSATEEEKTQEMARSTALIKRLEQRKAAAEEPERVNRADEI